MTYSIWIFYVIVELISKFELTTYLPFPSLPSNNSSYSPVSVNIFQRTLFKILELLLLIPVFLGFSPLYLISYYGCKEIFRNISNLYLCFHCSFGSSYLTTFFFLINLRTAYSNWNYSTLHHSDVILSYFYYVSFLLKSIQCLLYIFCHVQSHPYGLWCSS